jgi:hypothetical protein
MSQCDAKYMNVLGVFGKLHVGKVVYELQDQIVYSFLTFSVLDCTRYVRRVKNNWIRLKQILVQYVAICSLQEIWGKLCNVTTIPAAVECVYLLYCCIRSRCSSSTACRTILLCVCTQTCKVSLCLFGSSKSSGHKTGVPNFGSRFVVIVKCCLKNITYGLWAYTFI